jgi:hypothetical protein
MLSSRPKWKAEAASTTDALLLHLMTSVHASSKCLPRRSPRDSDAEGFRSLITICDGSMQRLTFWYLPPGLTVAENAR